MSHGTDIDRLVKDPSLLVDLCREVIDRLDAGENNTEAAAERAAMEAQLREIAKAVEKLEKLGVPVPDALRAEKTRLAAALGVCTEATQALKHLADELEELLRDLKSRLGRDANPSSPKKPRAKRSNSPKTGSDVLRAHIILTLQKLGGCGRVAEVLDEMEKQLKGKLLPGDLEIRQDGKTIAWQNNACWERYQMTQDGILKTGSPRGIWELSEDRS
jgi:hypothetical protein